MIYHLKVNVNLIEEGLIQIKSGVMTNVDASIKNIYAKKVICGILLHLAAKMVDI